MLELSSSRKNKVNLPDYDCERDIKNRMLMSDFSDKDIEILEEILYSPLKIPTKKLSKACDLDEEQLFSSLDKLAKTGLLTVVEDTVHVDKEMRKYFEFEITRFDSDFKPDMEFLQALLKKVPIHILPTWYSIPRTSNNIFESIVEKYLLTPHIFQRYLQELIFPDPALNGIIQDVYNSPDFKVSSTDLIEKYNLERRKFEELILILEFNFACCLTFEKQDEHWGEFVTPFYEWHEYLRFCRETKARPIEQMQAKESDFAFIKKMSDLLLKAKHPKCPIEKSLVFDKVVLLNFAEPKDGFLQTLEAGDAWLDLSLENRALQIYRHPDNRILSLSAGERYVREAEKCVKRVLDGKWVYFNDFLKGILVPLSENSVVSLKKSGKQWGYSLPLYSDDEKKLLHATIFEWLYELGMTYIGTHEENECFALTPFGRFFFAD